MRISSLALSLVLLAGSAPVGALDGPRPAAPIPHFGSAGDAVRAGMREYNAGDKIGAVKALEYAATQGHALALWKLGRMYADGDGVPHNDLRAFEYFSKIADDNAEEGAESPNAAAIASAFVALGAYFLEGIPGTYVRPNAARAREMFSYAASYFGDPNAQYSLARLYLDGTGVDADPRQAARWLNLAAEKGHTQAQALLGQLLLNGRGVPRQRARGLMWLTMAREAADPVKDPWIATLYDKAFETVGEPERQAALAHLEQYLKRRR
jgi:uncharacterized protein